MESQQIPKLIAIIGSGVSGLGAAWKLSKNNNFKVTIFEKSANISGRASTRRKEGYFYDNGANYFTTENKDIEDLVTKHFPSEKLVEITKPTWTFDEHNNIKEGKKEDGKKRYTYSEGIKGLSKLIWSECQSQVNLQYNKRLDRIIEMKENDSKKLKLMSTDNEELGIFDLVLLTPPAPQIADIFKNSTLSNQEDQASLYKHFKACTYKSIISVSLVFNMDLNKEYFALINTDRKHNISWLSFENDKKGHIPEGKTMMIVQMANNWSKCHYEDNDENLKTGVFGEVKKLFPDAKLDESYEWGDVKKWKFALPEGEVDHSVYDSGLKHNLYFSGDFVRGKGRVLDAFEEGLEVAGKLINEVEQTSSK